MTIAMASDHAGFALKQQVQLFLEDNGAKVKDFGCYSAESCDYPDFAHPLAEAVEKGEYEFGIIICSTVMLMCSRCRRTSSPYPKHWISSVPSSRPISKADVMSAASTRYRLSK